MGHFVYYVKDNFLRGLTGKALCHPLQFRNYFRGEQFHFSVMKNRIKTYHSESNAMVMTESAKKEFLFPECKLAIFTLKFSRG